MGFDIVQDPGVGPMQGGVVVALAIERHLFDEPDLDALVSGELDERHDVVDVFSLHHHGVDLHSNVVFQEQVQGVHDGLEFVAACDDPEAFAVERVQAEVHRRDAHLFEGAHVRCGQHPIGGEVQVFDARNFRDALHEIHEVVAHKRLAPREADLRDAERCQQCDEAFDLFKGEQVFFREIADAVFGHTVKATQVAAVGYGQAQVGEGPPMIVVKRGHSSVEFTSR